MAAESSASMWVPKLDPPPRVTVTPDILTVAVGGTAAFTATVTDARSAPTYQWLRDGATIAGATGPTYTLTGANLGDDSARFMVQVAASNGTAFGSGLLQVSPLPGVVVEDGDFTLTNWVVAAVADPARTDPTQSRFAIGHRRQPRRLQKDHIFHAGGRQFDQRLSHPCVTNVRAFGARSDLCHRCRDGL